MTIDADVLFFEELPETEKRTTRLNKAIKAISTIGVVSALGACGGGVSGEVVPKTFSPIFGDTLISSDGEDIFYEREVVAQASDEVIEDGDVQITTNSDSSVYAVRGIGEYVQGFAIDFELGEERWGNSSRFYMRQADEGGLPGGTATFSGDYRGLVNFEFPNQSPGLRYITKGEATLEVDFDNELISGAITDRVGRDPDGTGSSFSYNDITLENGNYVQNGRFYGTASGGDDYTNSSTALGGRYVGGFGGPEAEEAVVGVRMDYGSVNYPNPSGSSAGFRSSESGVILADKDD